MQKLPEEINKRLEVRDLRLWARRVGSILIERNNSPRSSWDHNLFIMQKKREET